MHKGNIALQKYKYKFPTCNILSKMYEIFAFSKKKSHDINQYAVRQRQKLKIRLQFRNRFIHKVDDLQRLEFPDCGVDLREIHIFEDPGNHAGLRPRSQTFFRHALI